MRVNGSLVRKPEVLRQQLLADGDLPELTYQSLNDLIIDIE